MVSSLVSPMTVQLMVEGSLRTLKRRRCRVCGSSGDRFDGGEDAAGFDGNVAAVAVGEGADAGDGVAGAPGWPRTPEAVPNRKGEGQRSASLGGCRASLQRAVHGRPRHGEQLGEVGDAVVAGSAHPTELAFRLA